MLSHFHDAFYMHIFDPFFQSVAIREQSQQTCTSEQQASSLKMGTMREVYVLANYIRTPPPMDFICFYLPFYKLPLYNILTHLQLGEQFLNY